MKSTRSLIWIAVLVLLFVAQVASAQNYSAGRYSHAGGWRQPGPGFGFGFSYQTYGVGPSYLSRGWDCGNNYPRFQNYASYSTIYVPPPVIYQPQPIYYSQPAVVYTQPAVMIREARVPAVITTWDDGSLLSLGSQKFAELSGTSDVDAKNLRIAILEKDYQTTKGVRVIEEVKFLAKWVVVIKDKDGHEREQEHSKKFKLKFDDYGNWEKFDD